MKNYLDLLFIKCFWTCGLSQHCTDAQKWRMQSMHMHRLQPSTFHPDRICQPSILKDFIYCSSNHEFIKSLWMWLIRAVMEKRTLHFTSSGVYPVHLRSDTSLQLPTFRMCSYQVLNTYPNLTASIILVVNQSSLNVPKFKTSSCCRLTRIQLWAACLGLHTRLTSTSKDAPGAMQQESQHHSSPPIN